MHDSFLYPSLVYPGIKAFFCRVVGYCIRAADERAEVYTEKSIKHLSLRQLLYTPAVAALRVGESSSTAEERSGLDVIFTRSRIALFAAGASFRKEVARFFGFRIEGSSRKDTDFFLPFSF